MQIHDLRPFSTGEVYDISQAHGQIEDGDILIALHRGRTIYAFMCEAWPVALDGYGEDELQNDETFAFHFLADINDIETLDGGKYAKCLDIANAHVLNDTGLLSGVTVLTNTPIA